MKKSLFIHERINLMHSLSLYNYKAFTGIRNNPKTISNLKEIYSKLI